MKFGDTLKSLRKLKLYTLKDLHIKTGLSISYLSLLEQGKRSPSLESLTKIANGINIPVAVIVFLSASKADLEDESDSLLSLQDSLQKLIYEN